MTPAVAVPVIRGDRGGWRESVGRGIAAPAACSAPKDVARSSGQATMSCRRGRGLRRRGRRRRQSQKQVLLHPGHAMRRAGRQDRGSTARCRARRGRSAGPGPTMLRGSMPPRAPSPPPRVSAVVLRARRSRQAARSARRKAPAAPQTDRCAACRWREGGIGSVASASYW